MAISFVERGCPVCGKTYHADPQRLKHGRQTTCSRECSYQYRGMKSRVDTVVTTCAYCSAEFSGRPCDVNKRYCSIECYQLHRAKRAGYKGSLLQFRFCLVCGKQFKPKNRRRRYCSRTCFEAAHKENMAGTNNPSYIDGRSITTNYDAGAHWHEIRKQVYERDSYTCQRCGVKCISKNVATPKTTHKIIQCHHIDPYKKSRNNSLDNLITLCLRCHRTIHARSAK